MNKFTEQTRFLDAVLNINCSELELWIGYIQSSVTNDDNICKIHL
jgi:hypothetical protein